MLIYYVIFMAILGSAKKYNKQDEILPYFEPSSPCFKFMGKISHFLLQN